MVSRPYKISFNSLNARGYIVLPCESTARHWKKLFMRHIPESCLFVQKLKVCEITIDTEKNMIGIKEL